MSKITVILLTLFLMVSASTVSAQGMMETNLDTLVVQIQQSQGVSSSNQIDCQKVTDSQFEKLGDAWMDTVHPNESTHEQMDQMMGGEGSQSLEASHIQMGRNYLGCDNGWNMGTGMMSFRSNSILDTALIAVLLINGILLAVFLVKKINLKK